MVHLDNNDDTARDSPIQRLNSEVRAPIVFIILPVSFMAPSKLRAGEVAWGRCALHVHTPLYGLGAAFPPPIERAPPIEYVHLEDGPRPPHVPLVSAPLDFVKGREALVRPPPALVFPIPSSVNKYLFGYDLPSAFLLAQAHYGLSQGCLLLDNSADENSHPVRPPSASVSPQQEIRELQAESTAAVSNLRTTMVEAGNHQKASVLGVLLQTFKDVEMRVEGLMTFHGMIIHWYSNPAADQLPINVIFRESDRGQFFRFAMTKPLGMDDNCAITSTDGSLGFQEVEQLTWD
jgi:hypothetical protein